MTNLDDQIKETLVFIAQRGWAGSQLAFFPALAKFLGEKLEVEYALIDELLPDQRRARTLGLYAAGEILPDLEYDLRGTPCENVMGKTLCCYPSNIRQLFPEDLLLRDMAAECYLGIPLWDSRGEPIGLIAVMGRGPLVDRDLAESLLQLVAVHCAHELELKRAEEAERRVRAELLRHQKLESVGSLASGVAHDMNNVLAAILGLATVLRNRLEGDAASVRDLDLLLKAVLRGRTLVKGLTDFARDGLKDAIPVDLNQILRQEAELMSRAAPNRVELVLALDESAPEALGEPSSLANVVMNLCVNAMDAMPTGGRLTLRSRNLDDAGVEVSVEDTGHGMSPEIMAKALDPYFTTKPLGKGTGLGLSIVYGVMKAHGGTCELRSEPGRGTTAVLHFPPLARAPRKPAEPTSHRAPAVRSLGILLVDDEELIRESTSALFEHGGHRVELAATGREGLDLLRGGLEVDLVVLDQNMPGMTGVETLKELRRTHPTLPVLLSTGRVDHLLEVALSSYPGVWLLRKPFDFAELKAALKTACP
ncbi:ATP-binding protein [Geothrix alkalitolerans]|uniref:hybrid sensor histidine kinase/response regulator n=1 Tax=Geothrix alkalitolerans TaxID=2922724 RepID=UPI001FAF1C8C|nr:ATP-binding protein [Geothrix alkalitolerans]